MSLFSPLSKQKQPNVRNLLNQLNHSLDQLEKSDVPDKTNIAINKMHRRKRLYNPLSQKVEEAFENSTNLVESPEKARLLSPNSTSETPKNININTCNTTKQDSVFSVNSLNENSHRSIPAGQANINIITTYADNYRPSISPSLENNSLEKSKFNKMINISAFSVSVVSFIFERFINRMIEGF